MPVLPSQGFMVSCIMFKYESHFEFIFVPGMKVCSNFLDLHASVQLSQHHMVKRLSFPQFILFHGCIFLNFFLWHSQTILEIFVCQNKVPMLVLRTIPYERHSWEPSANKDLGQVPQDLVHSSLVINCSSKK